MEGATWTAAIEADGVLLAPKEDGEPAVLSYSELYGLLRRLEIAMGEAAGDRMERIAVEAYGEFGAAIEVGHEEAS
jgi:hypothetical protein